jgi:small-conductance mechanosensitive channel
MFDFVTHLDDFFLALFNYSAWHFKDEFLTAVLLLTILIIVVLLQNKAVGLLSRTEWRFKSYGIYLSGLFFPFMYLVIVRVAGGYLKGELSFILFESIAYFYLGAYIIRTLLDPLEISYVPWNAISYFLLLIAAIFGTLANLDAHFIHDAEIHDVFSLVFKFSVVFLIYIFLLRALKRLTGLLSEKLSLKKTILGSLLSFISVLYIIVAALWLFKLIGFASSFFLGGAEIFMVILVYGFLRAYTETHLRPKIEPQKDRYDGLLKNIDTFLNLLFIYVLFIISVFFFDLDVIVKYLSGSYLINTGLIAISVYSLIAGAFVFFFLLSFLEILKHLVYLLYIKRGKELEAGSLKSLVSNLGLLIIVLITLSVLGLSWKALLPIAGALGIGIGIGLQNIMNNYISGFILLFSKRLKIGDIIEVEGNAGRAIGNQLQTIYGRVASIDTFSSVISTTDGIEVVVPNSKFIEQQLVNYSLSNYTIRVRTPFGVSYSSDPNTVKEILIRVARENTQILKSPEPSVWFTEYADSALVFYLLYWVNIKDLWKLNPVISDIYFKAWYELEKGGIVIPFPQRDVWFKNNLKVEIEKEILDNFEKRQDGGEDE